MNTVSAKCEEIPLFSYLKSMYGKFIDYNHIFEHDLQVKSGFSACSDNNQLSCLNKEALKFKTSQLKFDIGGGKLNLQVEFLAKSSIANVTQYLKSSCKAEQDEEFIDVIQDNKIMSEHFLETVSSGGSVGNSDYELENDDSNDFVLITTSESFADHSESILPEPKAKPREETKRWVPPATQKAAEADDDYGFTAEQLFKNKPKIKRMTKIDDKQRNRCNSDTTA